MGGIARKSADGWQLRPWMAPPPRPFPASQEREYRAPSPAKRGRVGEGVRHTLSTALALCGALPLSSGLLLGLFLAGAAGSAMHCVPMCGGFVLGQVADRMARVPAARLCEWRRIRGGALLPYHAGRLTTYAGLGAASGLIGATLARLPWFGFASAALLLLGAALFLAQAVRRMVPAMARVLPALNGAPFLEPFRRRPCRADRR